MCWQHLPMILCSASNEGVPNLIGVQLDAWHKDAHKRLAEQPAQPAHDEKLRAEYIIAAYRSLQGATCAPCTHKKHVQKCRKCKQRPKCCRHACSFMLSCFLPESHFIVPSCRHATCMGPCLPWESHSQISMASSHTAVSLSTWEMHQISCQQRIKRG